MHAGSHSRSPVSTATLLGIVPGLGCAYARKPVHAAAWFVSVAFFEVLFFLAAFPRGGLTGFGVLVVALLQGIALLIWGGSIVAGRQHVRRQGL